MAQNEHATMLADLKAVKGKVGAYAKENSKVCDVSESHLFCSVNNVNT